MVFARVGAAGEPFEMELPEQAKSLLSTNARLVVSLADGSALPSWLLFDAKSRKILAKRLPKDALPFELMIKSSGLNILLVVQPMVS